MSKSAFGIEHNELAKASAAGTTGDKRNTKYAGSAYAGSATGSIAGSKIGARTAGVSARDSSLLIATKAHMDLEDTLKHVGGPDLGPRASRAVANETGGPMRSGVRLGRAMFKDSLDSALSVPGGHQMYRGTKIGSAVGAVAGTAAYAAHRHHDRAVGAASTRRKGRG